MSGAIKHNRIQNVEKEKLLEQNIAQLKTEVAQLKKIGTLNPKSKEPKLFSWPEGSENSKVQTMITPFLKKND